MLIEFTRQKPNWVDDEQVKQAQKFYQENIMLINLGLSAALVESYTFPADAQILYLNGGLTSSSSTTTSLRLLQTGCWIHTLFTNPGLLYSSSSSESKYLSPELLSCIAIRLIHGLVRRRTAKNYVPHVPNSPPVSQAQLLGTLLLFTHTTLLPPSLLSLPLSPTDLENYFHAWKYISHLIGVHVHLGPQTWVEGEQMRRSKQWRERR
eukprot:TRINITY_DN6169_c0_g1_i1.p1 TRINITY_DN6169_c0_g1~~TRINITY_DN6169_c0_g1_i1.p1  ORF type:complete len:208 (-),score=47.89 TRINITY_DN6169_c0_g1_i1:236-859(-)